MERTSSGIQTQFMDKLKNQHSKAAGHAGLKTVNQLPAIATHRLHLLSKILQLISLLQITASREDELELLFAGLSI
ncbi:hypothetical protein ACOSQ3_031201 [Xanthoceras sorbifolium]